MQQSCKTFQEMKPMTWRNVSHWTCTCCRPAASETITATTINSRKCQVYSASTPSSSGSARAPASTWASHSARDAILRASCCTMLGCLWADWPLFDVWLRHSECNTTIVTYIVWINHLQIFSCQKMIGGYFRMFSNTHDKWRKLYRWLSPWIAP